MTGLRKNPYVGDAVVAAKKRREKERSSRYGYPARQQNPTVAEAVWEMMVEVEKSIPQGSLIQSEDAPDFWTEDDLDVVNDAIESAWRSGIRRGLDAYENADVPPGESRRDAAFDAEQHARDYSPFDMLAYGINRLDKFDEWVPDHAWTAYDEGVSAGIDLGISIDRLTKRSTKARKNPETLSAPEAFLWDADANPGMVVAYAHVGQHSEASSDYYTNHTAPARLSDPRVQSLKRELESIGYILRVVERKPSRPVSLQENETRVTFRYPT